ncbi:MAG: hypothetical protein JXB49_07835 [Bacteroidales bacterium]|nr:hypothetical protein [Bacteroidales bacterium]
MTAQTLDTLVLNGEEVSIATEPFAQYLNKFKKRPTFFPKDTGCSRGYYSTWEVKDEKLFLIGFEGRVVDWDKSIYCNVSVNSFFPNQNEVFADWFTGEIRVPKGQLLDYVHSGYFSTYEIDLFLEFENGQLVGRRTVDNYVEEAKRNINEGKKPTDKIENVHSQNSWLVKLRSFLKKK